MRIGTAISIPYERSLSRSPTRNGNEETRISKTDGIWAATGMVIGVIADSISYALPRVVDDPSPNALDERLQAGERAGSGCRLFREEAANEVTLPHP